MKRRGVALLLAGATALAACAPAGAPPPALWDRLGGHPVVQRVVDDLLGEVATDPLLRPRFIGQNLRSLTARVVEYLCEQSGGPCRYQGRDLRVAHIGMSITAAEWEGFMAGARRAVERNGVPRVEGAELLALIQSTRNDIVGF